MVSAPFIALADDLSGGAEAATLLAGVTEDGSLAGSARLTMRGDAGVLASDVVVHDTNLRDQPKSAAADEVERIVAELADVDRMPSFIKVDSLLRGPVAAFAQALSRHGQKVVLAPALPALRRATVRGKVVVDGVPVAQTGLLHLEADPSAGDALRSVAGLAASSVSLDEVRRGPSALFDSLLPIVNAGAVAVVDAETDADLDTLVAAIAGRAGWSLVGSGGAAAALGRARTRAPAHPSSGTDHCAATDGGARTTLLVVGSGSDAVTAQLEALAQAGVLVVDLPHALLLELASPAAAADDGPVSASALDPTTLADSPSLLAAREALQYGPVALTIADRATPSPHASRRLVSGLARAAALVAGESDLVLTGGETARHTLDLLGIDAVDVVHVIDHGCVCGRAEDGRWVVTRPGSFGGPDNLLDSVRHLRPDTTVETSPRKAESQ